MVGGSRSGKSAVAERLAGQAGVPVTYVATGRATDPDMARRIQEHQARRPAAWTTIEAHDDLVGALAGVEGPVLVDSLGTWLAGHPAFDVDADGLCAAVAERPFDTVVVSEEVGMGVHPETEVGRQWRDALGTLNQRVAAVMDRTILVVAGQVMVLDGAESLLEGD